MGNKLTKKYGLFTAICMVVGIVIGSGVFFKAQVILEKTGGNMGLGIAAWLIGGAIMLVCLLTFADMAQKIEKVNGIVDYAEATVGKRYAYYVGWFMTTVYYPTLTSVLCWLSARYTLVFITSCWPDFPLLIPASEGGCVVGPECIALMMVYMIFSYAVNALSPKLAGKFQTSTTVIKLIPLLLMAVVGVIAGVFSPTHMLVNNFTAASNAESSTASLLFAAVCSTSFAYEGWIIATSINAELRDSKKNLPKALIIGGAIIISVYILYYIGVAGGASVDALRSEGATIAFTNIFGGVFGNILNLFIAISCMGTMNGLMLGSVRGLYSISARNQGPKYEVMKQVDDKTNIPNNSAIAGLLLCGIWGCYFYLANLSQTWTGPFAFDSSEIPIVVTYLLYIPIFVMWMVKSKDEKPLRRFVLPVLSVIGSLFMITACIVAHKWANLWFIILFLVIMLIGSFFYKKNAEIED